jgi:hypothetical protein
VTAGSRDVLASPGEGRDRGPKSGSKSTGGNLALSGDDDWTAAVDSLFAD